MISSFKFIFSSNVIEVLSIFDNVIDVLSFIKFIVVVSCVIFDKSSKFLFTIYDVSH